MVSRSAFIKEQELVQREVVEEMRVSWWALLSSLLGWQLCGWWHSQGMLGVGVKRCLVRESIRNSPFIGPKRGTEEWAATSQNKVMTIVGVAAAIHIWACFQDSNFPGQSRQPPQNLRVFFPSRGVSLLQADCKDLITFAPSWTWNAHRNCLSKHTFLHCILCSTCLTWK